MLNCTFVYLFIKILTTRLTLILGLLIAPSPYALIKKRYILESMVTTHEVLHSVYSDKTNIVALKLDYEKAFEKVNLDFVEELLTPKGFVLGG
jgi:hypothetical protein